MEDSAQADFGTARVTGDLRTRRTSSASRSSPSTVEKRILFAIFSLPVIACNTLFNSTIHISKKKNRLACSGARRVDSRWTVLPRVRTYIAPPDGAAVSVSQTVARTRLARHEPAQARESVARVGVRASPTPPPSSCAHAAQIKPPALMRASRSYRRPYGRTHILCPCSPCRCPPQRRSRRSPCARWACGTERVR